MREGNFHDRRLQFKSRDAEEFLLKILSWHDTEDYLNATGGYWNPFARDYDVSRTDRLVERLENARNQPIDLNGNIVTDPSEYVYFRERGTYIAGDYTPATLANYFPNESGDTDHATPMEGFADSFAVFTIYGDDVLSEDARGEFFAENMQMWISELQSREETE